MQQDFLKITLIVNFLIIAFFLFFNIHSTYAEMSSTNYSVPIDELGEAGGTSTSTNYKIEHNFGEVITGSMLSTNYKINSGYIQSDLPILIFTVSASSVNFGVLTTGAVSTDTINLTTSTNAVSGYSVKAYDNTSPGIANGMIDGVKKIADATTPGNFIANPSAGTEHYGLTVTGTHANAGYSGGTKINSLDNTTWVDLGSYSSFISDDILAVEYRASISDTTPATNNYEATTTYICTGNY